MLGDTLRRLRGIYGYGAREMSALLGISSSYLSEIEHGKKQSSVDRVVSRSMSVPVIAYSCPGVRPC